MPEPSSDTLHATTVAIDGEAVVIEGRSGAGKSDLALRLIDRGATLVSDDRTLVTRDGQRLIARSPERMAGQVEVRGLGIVTVPHVDAAPVALVVRLAEEDQRLPERRVRRIAGIAIREVTLDPFRASTVLKVEWALRQPEVPPA
ncbi:MAG: aldolase [Sphingomonas bacterium]|uniref:HPr kinase/phosphorylase n=1 Tax=Sphingomonas bacterium TaxID=1895847 RepID=UPI0026127EE0|nr:HPr kinase/phosphatase C-terminal domain-containing protein [Sphingomonas bacterium]MDB5695637.1 aldolase [Sphingomonas bacterium]